VLLKEFKSIKAHAQVQAYATTKKHELAARHQAMRQEQEYQGELEIQRHTDWAQAERSKKELLMSQAETEAIKTSGSAMSEAQAEAELIKNNSNYCGKLLNGC